MANLNKVILLGNLTRDPELRFTPNGSPVAKFRLATNQRVRQQEEWKDEVCYIDIITFGKQAENVAEYLTMGNLALVEGRLHWHEWEGRDGQRRSKYDVVASTVQFLSRPNGDGRGAEPSGLPFREDLDDVPF
ncbi:MAG: single-stranded DNA-binding protein [Candidatus Entotheonella factor]|uniref:Single-stranded DNA-binding protein n=1 Tax=Entotheonella factor TaxID=1429438 RepID=W4LR44_ENTF1|nr:MAG: single-stranded DNA-binding protein [Candidatus Entotheonella factor]